jgi:hypothetical protein
MASGYYDRMQQWLPPPTEPLPKGLRVFWIDLMRIIGCIAVPIVHAINFTGTPGQPDPKHLGAFHCGYNARDPSQLHGRHYTPDTHSPESIRLEQACAVLHLLPCGFTAAAVGVAMAFPLSRPSCFLRDIHSVPGAEVHVLNGNIFLRERRRPLLLAHEGAAGQVLELFVVAQCIPDGAAGVWNADVRGAREHDMARRRNSARGIVRREPLLPSGMHTKGYQRHARTYQQ